jgi:hypothetical protein
MLNFIHKELHHVTERKVPVLNTETDNPNVDVYHCVKFQGVELDVCVYWPQPVEGEYKACVAMVKLTSDDLSDECGEVGTISSDAAWNADSKKDSFTLKNDKLVKNYWAPRWKVRIVSLPYPSVSSIASHSPSIVVYPRNWRWSRSIITTLTLILVPR